MKRINLKIIVALISMVSVFGYRVYRSQEKQKKAQEQQQMIEELARQQSEEMRHMQDSIMQEKVKLNSDSTINALNQLQTSLDSLGKKMKAEQEKFEKDMKK